jgi:hypothetical protein
MSTTSGKLLRRKWSTLVSLLRGLFRLDAIVEAEAEAAVWRQRRLG